MNCEKNRNLCAPALFYVQRAKKLCETKNKVVTSSRRWNGTMIIILSLGVNLHLYEEETRRVAAINVGAALCTA
jgi:hypothetical protein